MPTAIEWTDETMPAVIKRRRTNDWRMPENAVYVGRPTMYGNPFQTVLEFREWWNDRSKWPRMYPDQMDTLMGAMFQTEPHPLRGKDLVCWCVDWDGTGEPPGVCHAEVLLELANAKSAGRDQNTTEPTAP